MDGMLFSLSRTEAVECGNPSQQLSHNLTQVRIAGMGSEGAHGGEEQGQQWPQLTITQLAY